MARTKYKKKTIRGHEYYFHRLYHKNLLKPKDLYGKTIKELEDKIRKELQRLDNNMDNTNILFGEYFKLWLYDIKAPHLKKTTFSRYRDIYNNHIVKSDLVYKKVSSLKLHTIQSYYNNLFNNGMSNSMLKQIHKLIGSCIRYAYDNNIITKDFTRGLVIPKNEEEENNINPFTLEEQKAFENAIKGEFYEVLFLTALYSGLRRGELLALTWNDIDFTNKTINVNKTIYRYRESKGVYKNIIQAPKTKNSKRLVDIPQKLVDILMDHKVKQHEIYIKSFKSWINKYNLVFPNTKGGYINTATPGTLLSRILKINNIKHRRFHDLRHTYATRLFELGVNAKTVQTLMGHSDIRITLNTYTHVLEEVKKDSVSKLDSLF